MMKRDTNFRPARTQGFTLLELLVVLVVLGLLAGIVAPKYFSQLGRSEVKVAKTQIEGLGKALDIYRLETGHVQCFHFSAASRMSSQTHTKNSRTPLFIARRQAMI